MYAGANNRFYFALTDYEKRLTILSLYRLSADLKEDTPLTSRVYKLILRRVGQLYGVGHSQSEQCGVMKYSNSLYELDQVYPFYCEEDIKALQSIKILKPM